MLIVAVAVLTAGWAAGRWLVLDQPETGATHALLFDHPELGALAAEWYRARPGRRLLYAEPLQRRIVTSGAWPPQRDAIIESLHAEGVPRKAFKALDGEADNEWAALRRLGRWLDNNPQARVALLTDAFSTRRLSYVAGRVLPAEQAQRVSTVALPPPRVDPDRWWQSRSGWKAVLFGWLDLAFAYTRGEGEVRPDDWDPDEHVRRLADSPEAGS